MFRDLYLKKPQSHNSLKRSKVIRILIGNKFTRDDVYKKRVVIALIQVAKVDGENYGNWFKICKSVVLTERK